MYQKQDKIFFRNFTLIVGALAVMMMSTAASADGKKVFEGLCKACHGAGLPGIPQFGDKTAWAPRIAQGKDTLYQHAIKGFTGVSGMMMPPKGGGTNTDDEVKAAVDYMVSNSQ
jgi:cytochrome c5